MVVIYHKFWRAQRKDGKVRLQRNSCRNIFQIMKTMSSSTSKYLVNLECVNLCVQGKRTHFIIICPWSSGFRHHCIKKRLYFVIEITALHFQKCTTHKCRLKLDHPKKQPCVNTIQKCHHLLKKLIKNGLRESGKLWSDKSKVKILFEKHGCSILCTKKVGAIQLVFLLLVITCSFLLSLFSLLLVTCSVHPQKTHSPGN